MAIEQPGAAFGESGEQDLCLSPGAVKVARMASILDGDRALEHQRQPQPPGHAFQAVRGPAPGFRVAGAAGVIRSGEPLLDIVPSDDRLVVQARLDPNDIDVVHPGLRAQVRISAFNQRTTPTFEGRVTAVSADRLVDERTGAPYYLAEIDFDESQIPALATLKLYPGMPAEVMIVIGNRTAREYIWRPLAERLGSAFREQ